MTAEPVLQLKGFSAGYGPLRVLHDVDFIVNEAERIGIVGLNGHGKSTLLNGIAGLTGWQSGSVLFAATKSVVNAVRGPAATPTRSFAVGWPSCPREMPFSPVSRFVKTWTRVPAPEHRGAIGPMAATAS